MERKRVDVAHVFRLLTMKEANYLLYRAKRLCGFYVWEQLPPMAFDHCVADPMVEWEARLR